MRHTETAKPNVTGFDMPMVDYTIPYIDTIEAKLKKNGASGAVIKKVNELYDGILAIFGQCEPGDKKTFTKQESSDARKLVHELEDILKPHGMDINSTGGTVYNKFRTIAAICDLQVQCNLVGTVGKDAKGEMLKGKIKGENLNLVNNNEYISHTREAVHIMPRGSTNRVIGKFEYETPKFMNYDFILKKAKQADIVFIEGSTLKFVGGPGNLIKLVDELKANNKKMVFSPPTDKSFYFDSETGKFNRKNTEAYLHAARNADLVFMNEKEAVKFTGNPRFEDVITNHNDPTMQIVRQRVARDLSKKETNDNQLVFITLGPGGAIANSRDFEVFQKVPDGIKDKMVSTSGCGDAFTAGAVSHWMLKGNKEYNPDYIKRLLMQGTQVASAVIQEVSAQIAVEKLIAAALEKPPTFKGVGENKTSILRNESFSRELFL